MAKADHGLSSISLCKRPLLGSSGVFLAKRPHLGSGTYTCPGSKKSAGGSVLESSVDARKKGGHGGQHP